jgi:hypothetical protein
MNGVTLWRLRQAGGGSRAGTNGVTVWHLWQAGGGGRAGTIGVSVHISEHITTKSCKSRERILLSKIKSLKNRSFFRCIF